MAPVDRESVEDLLAGDCPFLSGNTIATSSETAINVGVYRFCCFLIVQLVSVCFSLFVWLTVSLDYIFWFDGFVA